MDPVVYCWMNDNFRAGFRRLLSCPCARAPAPPLPLRLDGSTTGPASAHAPWSVTSDDLGARSGPHGGWQTGARAGQCYGVSTVQTVSWRVAESTFSCYDP